MKAVATICSALFAGTASVASAAEPALTPHWSDVAEIFAERCTMCHSKVAGASKGLLLDDYSAALAGSENGAVLVAGNVSGSELIRRLRGESKPRMPFLSRPLPEEQIRLIEMWIDAGLPE
ncbi:hypothetical protein GQ651_16620 [Alphaproteobacteria bacterium GH1-50]|uniref:Cytochrome C Planctomycete-type domain-containing protein n=1 Tax=Kangsaoukella pontilimi TaxID=2691042 RepID=A0A7C9MGD2_9RHOB|nr:c-type cytochrome domain-containing protein [Kangsaoukella pontilimi]MXQ09472.1 hypothetical protein [Kangsaoukella pontilimi]